MLSRQFPLMERGNSPLFQQLPPFLLEIKNANNHHFLSVERIVGLAAQNSPYAIVSTEGLFALDKNLWRRESENE